MAGQLDAVLDDAYLEGLEERPTEEIRRLRAECEALEEAVSYARRLVQGRLDILRAELLRRRDDGDTRAEPLLDLLPTILSGEQAPTDPLHARALSLHVPEAEVEELEAEIDRIASTSTLDDLSLHDPTALAGLVDELAAHEQHLSSLRRQLFDRIDALRAELAARYKDGRAAVRDLLNEA